MMEAPPVILRTVPILSGSKNQHFDLAKICGGLATQNAGTSHSNFRRLGRSAPSAHQFTTFLPD
jgi:hypothetical protein